MVLKRIDPLSCAKVLGVLYATVGLVIGAVVSLASLAGGLASRTVGGLGAGFVFGIGSIVVIPVLYGALGFVVTLICAWLFNFAAGRVGGIKLDLQ